MDTLPHKCNFTTRFMSAFKCNLMHDHVFSHERNRAFPFLKTGLPFATPLSMNLQTEDEKTAEFPIYPLLQANSVEWTARAMENIQGKESAIVNGRRYAADCMLKGNTAGALYFTRMVQVLENTIYA